MSAIIYTHANDIHGEELAWIQRSIHDEGKEKDAWSDLFNWCYLRGACEMFNDNPSSIYSIQEFELLNELVRYVYPGTRAERFMWDTIRKMREQKLERVHLHANY
jgi:hypothetical protein